LHVDEHIEVEPYAIPGLPGVEAYAVGGPPALCVLTARLGGFGDPCDVVVSGINPGANTGRAVLHSGTVGAALTAANFGASGLAVSLHTGEPMQWATAAEHATAALEWLRGAPVRTVVNLNVPDLPPDGVRGVRWASLAPFGTVRAAIAESDQPGRLQMELRATGEELPPDSDTALVHAGYAAITLLVGVRAAPPDDARALPDLAAELEHRLVRRSAS
jgi:5'-nucleotidase